MVTRDRKKTVGIYEGSKNHLLLLYYFTDYYFIERKNGLRIGEKIFKLQECGIKQKVFWTLNTAPLDLS
jgi:hypothetical protein